jgi:type II restriction enzyme
MRGMLDLDSELYVAEQFWDFLGGNGTYQEVLGIFEEVGLLMRDEIDKKFSELK